jgi:hypothetical protein
LTLELYERLAPDLRESREAWVRREALPELEGFAETLFEGAVYTREEIEATVQGFESRGADAIVVLLLTYAASLAGDPAARGDMEHAGIGGGG